MPIYQPGFPLVQLCMRIRWLVERFDVWKTTFTDLIPYLAEAKSLDTLRLFQAVEALQNGDRLPAGTSARELECAGYFAFGSVRLEMRAGPGMQGQAAVLSTALTSEGEVPYHIVWLRLGLTMQAAWCVDHGWTPADSGEDAFLTRDERQLALVEYASEQQQERARRKLRGRQHGERLVAARLAMLRSPERGQPARDPRFPSLRELGLAG